jgi:putative protein kinase ArgK-like GTPase of G3E family
VLSASATRGTGIETIADTLEQHRAMLGAMGGLDNRRRRYQGHWLLKRLRDEFGSFGIRRLGGEQALLERVTEGLGSPFEQLESLRQRLFQELDSARPQ